MKFLIVKLSALGDVIQALPAAMALRDQLPESRIDWLVESPAAPLLQGHPALDRVLVSPRGRISWEDNQVIGPVKRFIKDLRSVTYDVVLDLQGLMKSAMLVALSRGGVKMGFRGGKEPLAALALNERLEPYDPERHALERYLDILEPLGLLRPARPSFGLEPEARTLAEARELMGEGRGDGPLVVLHPMAKWESKLWPLDHWVRLADMLAGDGVRLVLSGSQADRETTQAAAQRIGGAITDLAGKTDLKRLAGVLALADLVVSTDTGVMHLAAALGRPVVSLFGPTAPWRTGPYGQEHRALRIGAECSPCFQRECERPFCLERITPETVYRAVVKTLQETTGAAPAAAE